ncbi:hypothetical protein F511_00241 [Dorcoceras hygrometricum]|nr:hypothetical protein F511_00241 [Dorcoceras hygrometricum]
MAGSNRQRKSPAASSLFNFFKAKAPRPRKPIHDVKDDNLKACKVYSSDEDRGRWVAEPGIDNKASAYITLTTDKWKSIGVAN